MTISRSFVKHSNSNSMATLTRTEGTHKDTAHFPETTVIIPTRDGSGRGHLDKLLAQIKKQTYQNFEIVVVNDNGCDISDIAKLDKRIVVINNITNQVLAASRNAGLRVAQGRYVCFLDDDDYFYRMHFDIHMAELRKGHSVVYTDSLYITEELKDGKLVATYNEMRYSIPFDRWLLLVTNLFPVH